MKKPMNLNNNFVSVDKISFVGKIDTNVRAHLNVRTFFFTLVVDGKEIEIECDTREEIDNLRNKLLLEYGVEE